MQVVAAGGEALGNPGGLPGGAGCAGDREPRRVCVPAAGADRRLLQRPPALRRAGSRPRRRPLRQPAPLRQATGGAPALMHTRDPQLAVNTVKASRWAGYSPRVCRA